MPAWMLPFLNAVPLYTYPLLFLGAVVEGPVIMTAAGLFLRLGYFQFWALYCVLMAGDLAGDIAWYGIGYFWARPFIRKFGRFFSIDEAMLSTVVRAFHNHQNRILLLSKVTMGFGLALVVIMTAGMTRIPLKKFLLLSFLGQCVWTGMLLGLGYSFGHLYLAVNEGLRIMSAIAFLLFLAALLYGFGRFLRQKNFIKTL